MLILVGVSIEVLINSDLIGTAQNAGSRTETAYGEEGSMGGITVGNKNYDNIQDYIDGKGWTTLFEGEVTTTDTQALLPDDIVFNTMDTYRITVKSEEFEGEIITVPINEEGLYVFCAISEGEIIKFTSMEDVNEKMNNMENGTAVMGAYVRDVGSIIQFNGASCEYTITKIEVMRKGKLVFKGNLNLDANNYEVKLPFHWNYAKKYLVVIMQDNVSCYISDTAIMGDIIYSGVNAGISFLFDFARLAGEVDAEYSATILEIYELETLSNWVEEDGFGLALKDYYGNECSLLIETPNTSYIVPDTVNGVQVDEVCISYLRGEAIFTREFNLRTDYTTSVPVCNLKGIKMETTDYEFIFTIKNEIFDVPLDLSECGDDVEIPADYLEEGTYAETFSTIYVSSAVKEKYADNAKVVAK